MASLGNQYMTGLVRLEDQLLILLDVDRLFGEEATAGDGCGGDGRLGLSARPFTGVIRRRRYWARRLRR